MPIYPVACMFQTHFLKAINVYFTSLFFLKILALCMVSIEESNQEQVMMLLLVFKSSCLPALLKNKKGQMFA